LPDWTIIPCRISESFTLLFTWANMVDPPETPPPLRQAFSEMPISLSSVNRPCAISSKATRTVAILARLAGTIRSSAAFS
jgi:hypothetical protein